jgi:hypothetical protein
MGTWGFGPFENDDAADWLSELQDDQELPVVSAAFECVMGEEAAGEYLEVTDCCNAVAAAEIVAQLAGYPASPPAIDSATVKQLSRKLIQLKRKDRLISRAIKSVERVMTDKENSELSQLWAEDATGFQSWTVFLQGLLNRLRQAETCYIPPQAVPKEKKKSGSAGGAKPRKRYKYKEGSIVAIPLSNGQYAYAKVYRDYDMAIYNFLSDHIAEVEEVKRCTIAFFKATTDSAIINGEWPIIGEELFPDEDSAWGPPRAYGYVPECGIGVDNPKIEHKGKIRAATLEELKGLERAVFAQRPELLVEDIVSRLVEGKPSKHIAL